MPAAATCSRIVVLVVAFSLIGGMPACAQFPALFSADKTSGDRTDPGVSTTSCMTATMDLPSLRRSGIAMESQVVEDGRAAGANPFAADVGCLESLPATLPRTVLVNPCAHSVARIPGLSPILPCKETSDVVSAKLSALGKAGLKIERAREVVLNILSQENACAEWFETKDANPAATFQSLDFLIDERGQQYVYKSRGVEGSLLFRHPYVARATQDGGEHTAITINAHGAFYRAQGVVKEIKQEIAPMPILVTRLLMVGDYTGDTLPAQMVTLLHEFGHIIDLLPEDADDLDGKSVRNTDEVLRHCRAAVEAAQSK